MSDFIGGFCNVTALGCPDFIACYIWFQMQVMSFHVTVPKSFLFPLHLNAWIYCMGCPDSNNNWFQCMGMSISLHACLIVYMGCLMSVDSRPVILVHGDVWFHSSDCMISLHGISGFSHAIMAGLYITMLGSDVWFHCMGFLMSLHGMSDFIASDTWCHCMWLFQSLFLFPLHMDACIYCMRCLFSNNIWFQCMGMSEFITGIVILLHGISSFKCMWLCLVYDSIRLSDFIYVFSNVTGLISDFIWMSDLISCIWYLII